MREARNVIVTGGSRGLGLGIARRLEQDGFRAIVIARRESAALLLARQELEAAGERDRRLPFLPCDLAALDALPELVRCIRKQFGPVYALVNNAGISVEGLLAMTPVAQIEQVVRVNTVSPMVLTRHVVRTMMADGSGKGCRIVNISSITAENGASGLSVYAATKASLVGFTRSLARELGSLGITVNAVAPGFVATDLTASLTDAQRQKLERRSALKRLVSVEDVAGAVGFLLSDGAAGITGTVLTVDAGSTA